MMDITSCLIWARQLPMYAYTIITPRLFDGITQSARAPLYPPPEAFPFPQPQQTLTTLFFW